MSWKQFLGVLTVTWPTVCKSPPDFKPFILIFKKNQKLVIGHQKYRKFKEELVI